MDGGRRSNTTNALPEQSTTGPPANHTKQNRSTDKKTRLAVRSKARLLAHRRRNRAFLGALIHTIPLGVLGGLTIVLFGLIAATGGRIWVQNRVDFSKSRNLVTAAVALTMGAGNFTINIAGFSLGGIGTATFGAIIMYQLLREREPDTQK